MSSSCFSLDGNLVYIDDEVVKIIKDTLLDINVPLLIRDNMRRIHKIPGFPRGDA